VNKIGEKEIENTVRDFADSLEKKDVDKALSFFTDDATFFGPEGTFKGKEEIKRYITWISKVITDVKFTDDGVGIIVQGNKAVDQNIFSYTNNEGIKIKVNNVGTYEFNGEKIKNHWIIHDRLSTAKQATEGPIARKVVNSIIARMEKGLH
jgi:ketosteroid isomerase-like protein